MNQTTLPSSGREFSVQPLVHALTPFLVLPGASALVGVSYWLGADWLANPAMGIPAGAWAVILATAGSKLAMDGRKQAHPLDEVPPAPSAVAKWPSRTLIGALLDAFGRGTAGAVRSIDRTLRTNYEHFLGAAHDTMPWPTRPLRVGLRGRGDLIGTLPDTTGSCPVEWFTLAGSADPAAACRRHLLDAVVVGRTDDTVVLTNLAPDAEASWYDWAQPRPLSYSAVFPHAIDAEQVSLSRDGSPLGCNPRVARAIVEAAAALSRRPDRLDLCDRLRGRRPDSDLLAQDALTPAGEPSRLGDGALLGLAESLARDFDARTPTHPDRIGARVASAFLAAAEMDDSRRLRLMEGVARAAFDEPEVMLRLAAARFGSLQDSYGIDALLRADHLLRENPRGPLPDPYEFVQSELATGSGSSMSVGRVAAGICLLCLHASANRIPHLRDDLMEDMRYSGWLIGADQDRQLLLEVFRVLERAHTAAVYDLAASRAA